MKKIVISALSLLLLLTTNSCKDYLEVDHYDILPGDFMFQSEENVEGGLIGCYDTFYPSKEDNEAGADGSMWGFKPQYMLSNHPTLDTQASGWDKAYCTEDWTSSSSEFLSLWVGCYKAISRCNTLLDGLEGMSNDLFSEGEAGKKKIEAQARAIRAYNYLALAKNFGRVPMLMAGETYVNTPSKPRPDTEDETWQVIIDDLAFGASVLDWTPINGEYGRITKGFCLGYQAEALMYQEKYAEAKTLLKEIIDSNTYSLVPCFSYLYDPEKAWQTEDVFATVMWTDNGNNMSGVQGWSPTEDHYMTACYCAASMEYNGWGSLFISWECYNSFEDGDRRRAASMVALGETNPWTGQTIGANGAPNVKTGSEYMPNISSLKYWRANCDYWTTINQPFTLHLLRYAAILLNYAECSFQTGDETSGWDAIRQIRERAWGNHEVSLSDAEYPIPMQTETVAVPDAKTYYTKYKADKGYSSDVWMVAVNMERRHEFNAEFSLFYDLKRTGMVEEFINLEYPKGVGTAPGSDAAYQDWRTYRTFDYNKDKMLYPIPYQEILTNAEIGPEDQNPGY